MDMNVAYNQHSPHSRRSNRSTTNLNHLSLAPLTSKLPIPDPHQIPSPRDLRTSTAYTSYLEGKSAPTTPGILSRNSSHTSLGATLKTKSKSSLQLPPPQALKSSPLLGARTSKSESTTPHRKKNRDELSLTIAEGGNSDWLERAGVLITTQAQESRGQSWLTSRASSTSLTGIHNHEEEEYERILAIEREREMNRGNSRRNSIGITRSMNGDGFVADDEFSPITTRMSFGSRFGSRANSRMGSRVGSRRASKVGIAITPMARDGMSGYFDGVARKGSEEAVIAEPDFVDLEGEEHDTEQIFYTTGADDSFDPSPEEDELLVRRLAWRGSFRVQKFVEKLLGFNLFGMGEDGDEDEVIIGEDEDSGEDETTQRERTIERRYREFASTGGALDASLPLPPAPVDGEAKVGSWADAAWLLSVASRVLL